MGKALEGMVDVPMATLAGLVLKASGQPERLASQWVAKVTTEAKALLELNP